MVSDLRDSFFGPLFVLWQRTFTRPVAVRIFRSAASFFIGYAAGLWFFTRPGVVTFMRSLKGEGGTEDSIQGTNCSECQAETDQQ